MLSKGKILQRRQTRQISVSRRRVSVSGQAENENEKKHQCAAKSSPATPSP